MLSNTIKIEKYLYYYSSQYLTVDLPLKAGCRQLLADGCIHLAVAGSAVAFQLELDLKELCDTPWGCRQVKRLDLQQVVPAMASESRTLCSHEEWSV